jgi:O-antigen ligase
MITEKKKGLSLNIVLLALIGFFATWGEGMQHVFSHASLIYPALVAVYVVFNYGSLRRVLRRTAIVPKEFKILFLFILIHTVIYVIFNFNEIGFGRETGTANDEGFSYGKTESGMVIVRYFLFLLFSLYLAVAVSDGRKLKVFSFSYIAGFICTIIGGAYHSYTSTLLRFSGGLQDPNAMAFDAIIALLFTFYLFNKYKTKGVRVFLTASLVFDILAILISFSRGAYLAMLIWGIVYIVHKGLLRSLWKVLVVGVIALVIGVIAIRSLGIDTEMLEYRFSIEEMREKKGANRGLIWEAYLSNMEKYFVTGMGIGNSPSVMKGNKQGVSEAYESHNLYIQYFAEYGIIGLLLYLLYWRGYLRQFRKTKNDKWFLMSMGMVFLVVTFFLNIDKGRTFWIVLSLLNMVWMENIRRKTNGSDAFYA